MVEDTLYNGGKFPEYIFKNQNLKCLFLEFDLVFTDDFWEIFRRFLQEKALSKITIRCIEPKAYSFNENIDVMRLPASFKESAIIERAQEYIDSQASFYMLVEKGIIYSSEDRELFCLYLDRRHWIAIIGLSNPEDDIFFEKLNKLNLIEYFANNFKKENELDSFKKLVFKNWKISNSDHE